MPKERAINPATAQRKADKQKDIAKSKKHVAAQRTEKLARRNPERLQRQIDELKALEARSGGAFSAKDKDTLTRLERDVRGIQRAREARGPVAAQVAPAAFNPGRNGERRDLTQEQRDRQSQYLGKRRREEERGEDAGLSGEETDAEVRAIPMPRDTPPPLPRVQLADDTQRVGADGPHIPHALPARPPALAAPQTVYSSAPQMRDLKREAVRFVPAVVAKQKVRVKGEGRLLEPEEAEKLERAGYLGVQKKVQKVEEDSARKEIEPREEGARVLEDELAKFEREIAGLDDAEGVEVKDGHG